MVNTVLIHLMPALKYSNHFYHYTSSKTFLKFTLLAPFAKGEILVYNNYTQKQLRTELATTALTTIFRGSIVTGERTFSKFFRQLRV